MIKKKNVILIKNAQFSRFIFNFIVKIYIIEIKIGNYIIGNYYLLYRYILYSDSFVYTEKQIWLNMKYS